MNVNRREIIRRTWAKQCPNCGQSPLFPPHSFRIHRRCPVCGTGFDRGEGFYLGPLVINYTVTVFCFVLPVVLLGVRDVIPLVVSVVLAVLGGMGLPIALYRASWAWWLMVYFYFLPDRLPANGGATGSGEED